MKKLLVLVLLIAGCAVKQSAPPMPPGAKTPIRKQFFATESASTRVVFPLRVTLAFEAETVDTNYAPTLELGISAKQNLLTTNWQVIWTSPYPASTNTYPIPTMPGSWWTSNYQVTITVTLSNQPPDANNYRAFWRDKP